jgi:hypothetical protein
MLSTVGLVQAGLDFKLTVERGAPMGKVVDLTAIKKKKRLV